MSPDRENLVGTAWLDSSTLGSAFQAVAKVFPEKTAIVCGLAELTYRELDEGSTRVAQALLSHADLSHADLSHADLSHAVLSHGDLSHADKPSGIAAIYLDRSIEMVIAMIGVLKAGQAYLPIDTGLPPARVAAMLDDSQAGLVLTTRQLAPSISPSGVRILYIDELPETNMAADAKKKTEPDDVAYVIYTSGSTGKPKGVQVSHRNALRLFTSTQPWFNFGPDDVWTMFHSFAFDFSVWEMWGPLLTGGRLVIVPFEVSRSPEDFYKLLRQQRVSVLNQTPSAFQLLLQVEEQLKPGELITDLRWIIFGGEALCFRALRPWFARHGEAKPRLVNMYGITETTVHVTYRPVSAADAENETDSLIGVPLPDLRLHLLDKTGRQTAPGQTGELYIAGAGVALGYLHRPELNAERFVKDPEGLPGARMYRSGDLARLRPDGELVYLGRGDGQVKINGFRIELGEVEAALTSVPGIRQVCVTTLPSPEGATRLAAYYVSQSDISPHAVADHLRVSLPAHMLPAFYTRLHAMPLTGNGKIDREALPPPTAAPGVVTKEWHLPMEALLLALWRTVLGTHQVSVDDHFFEVGGSSLLLIALRTKLEVQLKRSIPVTWMFEHTTVRTLAARLSADSVAPAAPDAAKEKADRQRSAFARARTAKQAVMERDAWTT